MPGKTNYLEVAQSLAERLCREAIWRGETCNWEGPSLQCVESRWQVVSSACGPDLHSGSAGIALFLARVYACTGEEILKRTAYGALAYTLSQLDQFESSNRLGFYTGPPGIAYVLAEAGEIFADEDPVQTGLQLLETVAPVDANGVYSYDVLDGSAGLIPLLLNLHARSGRESLLVDALEHGDRLLRGANRNGASQGRSGWSWPTLGFSTDLTGFAHGAAGIAWALAELYSNPQARADRFRDGALQALSYERGWFDPGAQNWPDLRWESEGEDPVYVTAWCNGAAGIGLSRLRCYELLRDQECLTEAKVALATTVRSLREASSAGEENYSLCHGQCGNAELLIAAADVLGDQDSRKLAEDIADEAIEKYFRTAKPWPCGLPDCGETPSLMLGLAGIGYFYLRLHHANLQDRKKTPSVLLLNP